MNQDDRYQGKPMNRFPFPWAGDRNLTRGDCRPSTTQPRPAMTHPAGYSAPAGVQISQRTQRRLSRTTRQVLADPHLMRRVSDRVYALWQADQRQWRDRDRPHAP